MEFSHGALLSLIQNNNRINPLQKKTKSPIGDIRHGRTLCKIQHLSEQSITSPYINRCLRKSTSFGNDQKISNDPRKVIVFGSATIQESWLSGCIKRGLKSFQHQQKQRLVINNWRWLEKQIIYSLLWTSSGDDEIVEWIPKPSCTIGTIIRMIYVQGFLDSIETAMLYSSSGKSEHT